MRVLASSLCVLCVSMALPSSSRAFVAEDVAEREAPRARRAPMTQTGGGATPIRPRVPPPRDLDEAQLQRWATRMRVVLERCMQRAHPDQGFRVRMRIRAFPDRRLVIRSRAQPARGQAALERCSREYERRLQGRLRRFTIRRVLTTQLDMRTRPRVTNPPPPPPPEPTGNLSARVDAAVARVASRIRGCFPAGVRVRGEARFQVEVRPDGSLAMVGASLPPGLGNPQTLSCAAAALASVRIASPPTQARRVEAKLTLR